MARLAAKRQRVHPVTRLIKVLASFAIICGLVLLAAGSTSEWFSPKFEQQTISERLFQVLEKIQKAQRSLNSANFGQSRYHIDQIHEDISRLLAELHGVSEEARKDE